MNNSKRAVQISAALGLAAIVAPFASAGEFEPACHYEYGTRPAWTDIIVQSDRQAIGVEINANGALIALVPNSELSEQLSATPNRENWLDIFEPAP